MSRIYLDPVDALRDPEVKKFFLDLLSSSMSPEEKYDFFKDFFKIERDLSKGLQSQVAELGFQDESKVQEAVGEAVKNVDAWKPKLILEQTWKSLERALWRIRHSQHQDGGWGYEYETSHVWATAWTVLCLHRAIQLRIDGSWAFPAVEEWGSRAVEDGLGWLIKNRRRWSIDADDIPAAEENSIYDASVVLSCLFKTRTAFLPEVSLCVETCIARLLEEQNPDGDWDPRLHGRGWAGPKRSLREVGATSFVLQVLAATGRDDKAVRNAVLKGVKWLLKAQNPDGSWNSPAYPPPLPEPAPSVNKTCDAIKGLLAGRRLGILEESYQATVDAAVKWLLTQEQAVFSEDGRLTGWGWQSTELGLLENTCLTLETLLEIDSVALPHLASNALWLIRVQHSAPDSCEDGKWPNNDTGRIAFTLLDFYCRIKESPIFQPAEPSAASSAEEPAQESTG